jgi:hypothetical protein
MVQASPLRARLYSSGFRGGQGGFGTGEDHEVLMLDESNYEMKFFAF